MERFLFQIVFANLMPQAHEFQEKEKMHLFVEVR